MKIEGLTAIKSECERLIQQKEAELSDLSMSVVEVRSEINGLLKVLKALQGVEGGNGALASNKGKRLTARNGQPTRGQVVLGILQASNKALHVGDITRQAGLEDTAQNRTKINAAIAPMLQGYDSPVIRVAPATYAAR